MFAINLILNCCKLKLTKSKDGQICKNRKITKPNLMQLNFISNNQLKSYMNHKICLNVYKHLTGLSSEQWPSIFTGCRRKNAHNLLLIAVGIHLIIQIETNIECLTNELFTIDKSCIMHWLLLMKYVKDGITLHFTFQIRFKSLQIDYNYIITYYCFVLAKPKFRVVSTELRALMVTKVIKLNAFAFNAIE